MIKNIFIKLSLFWKIYFFLLFLSVICGIFISKDNDISWILFSLFYMPFSLYIVYPYGFLMGFWIQKRLACMTVEIPFLSIIYFILALLLLMSSGLSGILKNGFLYNIDIKLFQALGSTLLFAFGAIIAKFKQQK